MTEKAINDIPLSVKERLLELCQRLPEGARAEFIQNTTRRIKDVASRYESTLMYGAVGWVIGEILDNVLVIPFTSWALTDDNASQIGMLLGGLLGFGKDRKKKNQLNKEREEILTIIREEIQSSLTKN